MINEASTYFNFNANWERYIDSVRKNMLYHREMLAALTDFIAKHFADRPFSMADAGCGDSSLIAPVLAKTSLTDYIGIDEAADVLKIATQNLAPLSCEKTFISENMITAIPKLAKPVDIIFTSYAVHHLSTDEKIKFIDDCHQKLNPNGFLIMVDGVLEKNQTRDHWLNALASRMQTIHPDMSADELNDRMKHPTADDHPETIATLETIAKTQGFKQFDVLVDKGICAFMVFSR